MMNYGYVNRDVIVKQIKTICNCLGYGSNGTADLLLLETATTETGLGTIADTTEKAGMGICQFDEDPFNDLKKRSMSYRDNILKELGVDIKLVEWEHLRYNSFLSLLFCRLQYKPFNEEIPATIEGRGAYWKKYYNSIFGKGTVEHYLKMNKKDLI